MTLTGKLRLFWKFWPHKHKFGKSYAKLVQSHTEAPDYLSKVIEKRCKLCGLTRAVVRRKKKGAA